VWHSFLSISPHHSAGSMATSQTCYHLPGKMLNSAAECADRARIKQTCQFCTNHSCICQQNVLLWKFNRSARQCWEGEIHFYIRCKTICDVLCTRHVCSIVKHVHFGWNAGTGVFSLHLGNNIRLTLGKVRLMCRSICLLQGAQHFFFILIWLSRCVAQMSRVWRFRVTVLLLYLSPVQLSLVPVLDQVGVVQSLLILLLFFLFNFISDW
jgi:hypothetical protein